MDKSIVYVYKNYFKAGNCCTDSRRLKPGDIFIALKGDNFDGNQFTRQALAVGASLVISDHEVNKNIQGVLVVENSLRFLQKLANYHRENSAFKVVALTGTNGKTTTKELIFSVLSQKYKCLATIGNLNNHIGVPLTLLHIPSNYEIAIIEMGANHQGEIADLCSIAEPDEGLITNIGKAHLEGFGSYEGVKKAKSELYASLKSSSGLVYINGKDDVLLELVQHYNKLVKYGSKEGNCNGIIKNSLPSLSFLLQTGNDSIQIDSNLFGDYNIDNLLAACCIGINHGLSLSEIKSGIESYMPSNNRSQFTKIGTTQLLLDCYNANPSSMSRALQSFSELEAKDKRVILGGMKELGNFSVEEHDKVIELLESYDFQQVYLIGEEFKKFESSKFLWFSNIAEMVSSCKSSEFQNSTILVKGSRAYTLERFTSVFSS